MRAWVTGAAGSIGSALMKALPDVVGTDIDDGDITNPRMVQHLGYMMGLSDVEVIFNCAAEKSATTGELDPITSAQVNIIGTQNLIDTGIPVVLASTCKAADPETVYGATKLIAERMVLNAGGWVARFYNVIESSGNVFEIWRNTPEDQPILAMPCWRYFINIDQAVHLMTTITDHPPGRYTIDPGPARYIPELAFEMYGNRAVNADRRRGDRLDEPLHAQAESIGEPAEDGLMRIVGPHDPERKGRQ